MDVSPYDVLDAVPTILDICVKEPQVTTEREIYRVKNITAEYLPIFRSLGERPTYFTMDISLI